MITEAQRNERIKYIGSSDAAGVLGLSRWTSPLKVWATKTGQLPAEDLSDRLAIEVGNELEDLCAKLFERRTGKKVHRVQETIYHKEHNFIAANLDRRVVGEDALLECKTAGAWAAREWAGEEIPQEVIVQVLHQLAVTGKKIGYACVLIGGNQQFKWKQIHRDEKLIADLIRQEVNFWNEFILKKEMPLSIKKNDADTLYALFPVGEEDKRLELDDNANIAADTLEAYKADKKVLEGNIDRLENELKVMLKDASVGLTDRWKISWKNQITQRLDSGKLREDEPQTWAEFAKTIESRVLRVSAIKGDKQNGKDS